MAGTDRGETELALADCLRAIEDGVATVEEALGQYPELRPELEPLVRLAAELRAMPPVTAPDSLRGRRPVFRSAKVEAPATWWQRLRLRALPSRGWASPALRVAAALAVVAMVGSGTMVASAGSLPEEPLYPVKLAVENLRLAMATSPEARARLQLEFASRRLEEIEAIARQERTRAEAVEQGAALYEESITRAVDEPVAGWDARGNEPEGPQQGRQDPPGGSQQEEVEPEVQEALKHNYEVLERVREKLDEKRSLDNAGKADHERAIAAIEAAMERTRMRYESGEEPGGLSRGKGAEKGQGPSESAGSPPSESGSSSSWRSESTGPPASPPGQDNPPASHSGSGSSSSERSGSTGPPASGPAPGSSASERSGSTGPPNPPPGQEDKGQGKPPAASPSKGNSGKAGAS